MPELAFVVSPKQNWFFHELVEAIRFELAEQGFSSTLDTEFPTARADRVYVVVAPHEYVALEGVEALPDPAQLARTIYVCAEQPGTVHFDDDIELARQAGRTFDINPQSVALFRRAGIPAQHLPLGYTKRWDHIDRGHGRDIDVTFLGSSTPRRLRYLNGYATVLARWNCHLQISDNSAPNVGQSTSFLAEDKWDLLARSKILINLHQGEEPYFEWLRALDAMHCGAVLINEHSTAIRPLIPGTHLLLGRPETLADLAEVMLENPEELERLRRSAHEYIRTSMPFSASVAELAGAARALVAEALPPQATARPPRREHPPLPRRFSRPLPAPDPAAPIRAGLKEARLDLLDLRRQLARVEATLGSPDKAPPARSRRVAETRSWSSRRYSTVTVITALYNHSELVGAALDSVARSGYGSVEVIVVDDGSSDDSGAAVRRWMKNHDDIPALLLRHPINRGLGAARNTALDFARGRYVLILDADNVLYPRCLELLVATLDSDPEALFAYPILEVFGELDSYLEVGGDPLVSYYGWEPERLREGNYIDALAMIRTDGLRELGGYSTDRRLFAWEDYDLWCRIAESGAHGRLVPQILARYRASPNSMRSLTSLYSGDAIAALTERHPALMT
jgi:GT2 family glycosyltransferase